MALWFAATCLAAFTLTAPAHAAGTEQAKPSKPGAAAGPHRVLVVGDSLSAEYGLRRGSGWVALLEKRLREAGRKDEVINASISGDTTAGGRSRLAPLLARHRPTIVVIELGANDALRGLPITHTAANLEGMVQASQAAGARVLLVGIQVPPNFGRQYSAEFAGLFQGVAKMRRAELVPFLLRGVADGADPLRLFQADRIHPKEEAQPIMLDNVWAVLGPMLEGRTAPATRR